MCLRTESGEHATPYDMNSETCCCRSLGDKCNLAFVASGSLHPSFRIYFF